MPGGLPPARDPRMDRPAEAGPPLSLVVWDRATEPARHVRLGRHTLTRWQVVVALLAVVVLIQGAALAVAWPRAAAFDDVLTDNLALQQRLQRLDQRMGEVDRILLRLRLYDAQLESLGEPTGDAGPLPSDTYANASQRGVVAEWAVRGSDGGLRSSAEWAEGVEARANTFLDTFAAGEPTLHRFVGELEQLAALERALPSQWPAGGAFTSGFGWRRNPLGQRWRFHSGIDLAGDRGDPVYAAAQGRVLTAGWSGGYGRYIEIDHGFGITTLYGHCTRLLVSEGDVVRQGQKIGLMGSTGRSTGDHLHFEVHLDGAAVDPMDYLRRARRRAP